ncbi:MAG TPA: aromatic ring-hydroxylating dioxygenase subunit alpha [Stellaceae bacterium]|nr:aromatic ring-hydroxylating dioxygenase subunit alpha [Stellaceae bacterium]
MPDFITNDAAAPLADAIAAHRKGLALDRRFYTDPAIFEREMARFALRHWHCAGHASMAPEPGDFFTVEIGRESVILVRGQDGALRALLNVCRHRGSRVCTEAEGRAKGGGFSCPYHAWSYGLDGSLRAARQMPEDFDRSAYGLKTLPLRVIEGLVFIAFTDAPLGLAHVEEALAGTARPYGWGDARVAFRETYKVAANWKLAVENYMECYHCAPAHQEYSRFHVFARPDALNREIDRTVRDRAARLGVRILELDRWAEQAAPGEEAADAMRSSLYEGYVSGSEDGGPVAPLMGGFTDYDGGVTFFDVGPTSTFLAYPDHGLIYRFVPRTVDETEMEVIWLVRGDAREGVDYDLERLTWMWRVTSLADKRIIELNQQGVNSRWFEPGPYMPMEGGASRFVEWCLKEIG